MNKYDQNNPKSLPNSISNLFSKMFSKSHPVYIKKVTRYLIPSWCIGVGESFPWIN